MEVSKLIYVEDGPSLDLNLDIYASSATGEYKVFINRDGCTGASYDVKTTDDIAKYVKEYLETYCVKDCVDGKL